MRNQRMVLWRLSRQKRGGTNAEDYYRTGREKWLRWDSEQEDRRPRKHTRRDRSKGASQKLDLETIRSLLYPEMLCGWLFKCFLAPHITVLHGLLPKTCSHFGVACYPAPHPEGMALPALSGAGR